MNIGLASEKSGLPSKTIRYYEEIELIKPDRADNGYRDYSDNDIHRLRFLQRSRSLGFSIEECRLLLSLYEDDRRASADPWPSSASPADSGSRARPQTRRPWWRCAASGRGRRR